MRTIVAIAIAYGLTARACELALSAHNTRAVLARGGRRVVPDGIAGLVAVHVCWFAGIAIEDSLIGPAWSRPLVAWIAWSVFAAAELTRYACIATLGDRWNLRVIVEDGTPLVRRGPYRLLRHPNYIAATAGIVALPAALALPWTMAAFAVLKMLAVSHRCRIEEAALRRGPWA